MTESNKKFGYTEEQLEQFADDFRRGERWRNLKTVLIAGACLMIPDDACTVNLKSMT